MKEKLSTWRPIISSLGLGIVLAILVTIASAVSIINKFSSMGIMLAQAGAFLIMAVRLTLYMTTKGKTLGMFGFKKLEISKSREVLYYIPLLIIALVQPVIGGINMKLSILEVIVILLFTFIVGYTEETLFRGVIKEKLQSKGTTFYIIFSTVFFGMLHIANALNGDNLSVAIIQVINASLVGLILAELITLKDNIIPLIAFHSMYDALAKVVSPAASSKELLIISVLAVIYVFYAVYLFGILKKRNVRLKQEQVCL